MSFLDDAMTSIGQGLAQTAVTALSAETGVDVGGTLNVLFGGGQTTGGANLAGLTGTIAGVPDGPEKSLLTAQIGQQTQEIAALGTQLSGIATALQTITGDIADIDQMLKQIGQVQLYQDWSTVDTQLTLISSNIHSKYVTYGNYTTPVAGTPGTWTYTTPPAEVSGFVQSIVNDGVPASAVDSINSFIVTEGEQKGVLELWSAMVTPLVQKGVLDYRLAIQQYFEYYRKLVYTQLRATNLIMEAYIFSSDKTNADRAWSSYRTAILSQEEAFITSLVPLVYAGVEGGIFPDGSNFTGFEASLQLNPGAQTVMGDTDPGRAFLEPSPIFKDAESLLAKLFVTGPTDRRIVVHMIYEAGPGISNLLEGLDLPLKSISSSQSITSLPPTVLGSPFPYPSSTDMQGSFPDQNLVNGGGVYLKRYVFTDTANKGTLTDDQYTVADLNDVDGLIAIQTYMTENEGLQNAPFQQKSVVHYTLEVNAASPFDFMNFCAYSVPQLRTGFNHATAATAAAAG